MKQLIWTAAIALVLSCASALQANTIIYTNCLGRSRQL